MKITHSIIKIQIKPSQVGKKYCWLTKRTFIHLCCLLLVVISLEGCLPSEDLKVINRFDQPIHVYRTYLDADQHPVVIDIGIVKANSIITFHAAVTARTDVLKLEFRNTRNNVLGTAVIDGKEEPGRGCQRALWVATAEGKRSK